jgi:single-strand DNA-binding protein
MNKTILAGIVVDAGTVNTVSETQDVINFTLLTSDSYTDKEGVKKENTQFHKCSLFMPKGKAAHTAELLHKGRQVELEGKLKTGKSRDGKTREGAEMKFVNKSIVVNRIKKWGAKGVEKAADAA